MASLTYFARLNPTRGNGRFVVTELSKSVEIHSYSRRHGNLPKLLAAARRPSRFRAVALPSRPRDSRLLPFPLSGLFAPRGLKLAHEVVTDVNTAPGTL